MKDKKYIASKNEPLIEIFQKISVVAVVVTYGERRYFLEKTISALINQNIEKIIIVQNGIHWDIEKTINIAQKKTIKILRKKNNTGSAGGYRYGLKYAQKIGAEYIWLIDDDNIPEKDCLYNLKINLKEYYKKTQKNLVMVAAMRKSTKKQLETSQKNLKYDAFLNFHIKDIPEKILRKIFKVTKHKQTFCEQELFMAPYSGLLFHSSILDRIGLPKKEFLLYGDDGEFTLRHTDNGGHIYVISNAIISDAQESWNSPSRQKNSLAIWLTQGDDFRAYYYARNQTWIEYNIRRKNSIVFFINLITYFSFLFIYALFLFRFKRFRLLLYAVFDGLNSRLGESIKFKIPD